MWEAIQFVDTREALIAFAIAGVLGLVWSLNRKEETQIESAKTKDQANLAQGLNGVFAVDTSTLSNKDKLLLGMAQIKKAWLFRLTTVLITGLGIFALLAFVFLGNPEPTQRKQRINIENDSPEKGFRIEKDGPKETVSESKNIPGGLVDVTKQQRNAIINLEKMVLKLYDSHYSEGEAVLRSFLNLLPKSFKESHKILAMSDPDTWNKMKDEHESRFKNDTIHQSDIELAKIEFSSAFPELQGEIDSFFNDVNFWHDEVAHKVGENILEEVAEDADLLGFMEKFNQRVAAAEKVSNLPVKSQNDLNRNIKLQEENFERIDSDMASLRNRVFLSYSVKFKVLKTEFKPVKEKLNLLLKIAGSRVKSTPR